MNWKGIKTQAVGLCIASLMTFAGNGYAQTPIAQTSAAKNQNFTINRDEIRRSLFGYFGWGETYPAITAEPQMEVLEKVEESDHFRWHVRYQVDKDEQSYAYLLIPKPFPAAGQRLPLILCPHPTALIGKDRVVGRYDEPAPNADEAAKREARQYALDLVRAGYIAFAPDRAAYGQRRLSQTENDVRKQMALYQEQLKTQRPGWRLTAGKNVWDLQRALDFLVKLEFVDSERIGTIGHSLGAWDSLMILAADDRVKAAVVNSGGTLRFRPDLWENEQALRDYLGDPKKQQLNVNANLMFMLAAGRSLFYIWSTEDAYDRGGPNLVEGFRTIKNALKTNFKAEGKTDLSFMLHSNGHDFPPAARAAAYNWFKDKFSAVPVKAAAAQTKEEEPEVSQSQAFAANTEPLQAPLGVKKDNFHLYLLVGQSNMAGRGKVEEVDKTIHPRVFSLGKESTWIPAQEPLHFDIKSRGVGPGLSFGKAMADANPNATIGLIPAAVGGTLIEWWQPGAERHLFEDAVKRAKLAQTTGVLKGILWQQGESDSYGDRPGHYRERLLNLLGVFRRELGDPNVPIIIGGLGDFLKATKYKEVETALKTVAGEVPHTAFVPASKLGHIGDNLHFNSEAARENGQMMATAMQALQVKPQD